MATSFFGGSFFGGEFFQAAVISAAVTPSPGGVKKKKKVIHLSELSEVERLTTAQFLKAQLDLNFPRPKVEEIPGSRPIKVLEKERIELEAIENMRIEAENEKRIILMNNQIIAIILGGLDES